MSDALNIEETKRLFPDYEIVNEVVTSGEAVIYRVRHADFDSDLALKVMLETDQETSSRFFKEANLMNMLKHPHILNIIDFGRREDRCFGTMEFIEYDLLHLIAVKELSDRQAGQMVCKIAIALEYMHSKGVLHRDIKPANVMITQDGEPKIIDFGLAYVAGEDLSTLEAVGSEGYAAPEIWDNPEKVSIQSDIYSLGALLYTVLTQVFPDAHKVDYGKLFCRDQAFVPFILKAMKTDAARRHISAYEFAEELKEVVRNVKDGPVF